VLFRSLIGKPYEVVTTVFLRIDGEQKEKRFPVGEMLLIFVEKSALEFTNLLWNRKNKKLDESDIDALKETGNILSGACLSALTEYLNFKMIESMPGAATDMLSATMDSTLANLAVKTDEALVFMTDFKVSDHEIKSYFLILFDPNVLDILVEKIKEKSQ
jgi:chemotaxis protein CheC